MKATACGLRSCQRERGLYLRDHLHVLNADLKLRLEDHVVQISLQGIEFRPLHPYAHRDRFQRS
jgi:hypothetical protein